MHATADGVLVVTHDVEFSHATDVADRFPDKLATHVAHTVDGEDAELTGYWVSDFTLEEVKKLTVQIQQGRMSVTGSTSQLGTSNLDSEDAFRVPTVFEAASFIQGKREALQSSFTTKGQQTCGGASIEHSQVPYDDELDRHIEAQYLKWVEQGRRRDDPLRVVQMPKLSAYEVDLYDMVQRNIGTGYERQVERVKRTGGGEPLWVWHAEENANAGLYIETKRPQYYNSCGHDVEALLVDDIERSRFNGPIFLQSFELDSLDKMAALAPDWRRVKLCREDEFDLDDLDGIARKLDELAKHVHAIGPSKGSIVPKPSRPPSSSPLIEMAHARGLLVHPYTFRTDTSVLHRAYGGNAALEFIRFFRLGVDGVFADFPSHAVFARNMYERALREGVFEEGRDTTGTLADFMVRQLH